MAESNDIELRATSPLPHSSRGRESRGSIVVADDDPATLAILHQILTKANYSVTAVENGELACSAVRRELPDLALLDWEMPIMNGLAALKALKADAATSDIPVIMLTSHGFMNELGAHGGLDDFIVKPCNEYELIARVEQQRRLRRLFASNKPHNR